MARSGLDQTGQSGRIAAEALRLMREADPECLVDLHNNTGHNPAYGVGPRTGTAELNLVGLFAERFVHSDLRLGALVEAKAEIVRNTRTLCFLRGQVSTDGETLLNSSCIYKIWRDR